VTELEEKNKQIMFLTSRLAVKDQLISELQDVIKDQMVTISDLADELKKNE
jgi:uncharacterized coiled-coil protein SlyX